MKQHSIAAFAAALIFSAGAMAQEQQIVVVQQEQAPDYGIFNHMGIGVAGGILDGASVTAGFCITPHIQIRGGYSMLPYTYETTIDDFGTYSVNGSDRDFKNIDIAGDIAHSYYGFVDLYPSKNSAFHFTVGLFGSASGEFIHATADISKVLTPDEYHSAFVELEDPDDPTKSGRFSTDEDGFLHVSVRSKNALRPYLGIGFGRVANLKHRVSLSLDLGVQYAGGMSVCGFDYDDNAIALTSGMVEHKDKLEDLPVVGTQEDIIDQIADGKFLNGTVGNFMPVIKFGINVRLF